MITARLLRNERNRRLNILLFDPLTPLLKHEIHHAIKLHSETSQHANSHEDFDTLYDRIAEHWAKIHQNMIMRAHLMENMALFQEFLTAQLLADYANEPYTITP